jgi:hypothetical protein
MKSGINRILFSSGANTAERAPGAFICCDRERFKIAGCNSLNNCDYIAFGLGHFFSRERVGIILADAK